jgi:hypothetical protein
MDPADKASARAKMENYLIEHDSNEFLQVEPEPYPVLPVSWRYGRWHLPGSSNLKRAGKGICLIAWTQSVRSVCRPALLSGTGGEDLPVLLLQHSGPCYHM